MSQIRSGALIAIIVFAAFTAYAFLASATYRTSALLVVDSANPSSSANVPEPLEAARRLSEAILDRAMLEQLSRERATSGAPEAVAQAASSVRQGLEIDTSDARSFSISYKDTDRWRAQRACNELAHQALTLAPRVLEDRSAQQVRDLDRQEQTRALAAFLAEHPQVAAEAPPSGDKSPDKDPAISAFRAEKSNLEHRIAQLESGTASDNPYVDARQSDLTLLKRRLVEINTGLTARREALSAQPSTTPLSPDLRSEWKRLLDAVMKSSADAQTLDQRSLSARLAGEAPLPSAPIDPNRPLLLFFGVVFGVGFGAAFTLAVRAEQQRRPKSSRPPATATAIATPQVQLPASPALPSSMGPPVPVTPPASNRGPAIVPIPQHPISSNPPPSVDSRLQGPPPDAQSVSSSRENSVSSRPPPRRFASTLVLPPAENPTPFERGATEPDAVLASANQAWEEEIRAHAVPGFAVVRPSSEPPPPARASSSVPPPSGSSSAPLYGSPASASVPAPPYLPVSSAPPAAASQRPRSRPLNPMKVTQPLGSFLPEGLSDQLMDRGPSPSPMPSAPPLTPMPPRSPLPARSRSGPASETSVYSYVSKPPPSVEQEVVSVQPVANTWAPDARLVPAVRRPLCEQLYPLAVERCFVIGVVGVPESLEYKSRVAAELALAMADSGHPRILLLEADFHRPSVQRWMQVQMPMSSGFSQQLRAHIDGSSDARWQVLSCGKTLHVLVEGIMRSPGLLLSRQFGECLSDLRKYYDFIVVDGPTTSLDVDARAFSAVVDGLITVCPQQGSPGLAHLQSLFGQKRFSAFVHPSS